MNPGLSQSSGKEMRSGRRGMRRREGVCGWGKSVEKVQVGKKNKQERS